MFVLLSKVGDLGHNVDELSESLIVSLRQATSNVAKMAQGEWIRLAQSRLHSSRATYINGLRQAESFNTEIVAGEPVHTVQLVGSMPLNFELGMASFDMKSVSPGWLGGGKAKTAADGHRYMRIPFGHSTTSTTNIDYTGKAKAANLKAELKKTVRAYGLDRMLRTASGGVVSGPTASVPKGAPVHKYLQGLTRVQEALDGTTKSGLQRGMAKLMTFRTLSDKSAEDSWVHPGLPGHKLLDEVTRWTDRELDRIIEQIMAAA